MGKPRTYGVVQSNFWTDSHILKLSSEAKLLAIYLITSPHSNTQGLYRLPFEYVCADLGNPLQTVIKQFNELECNGFLMIDRDQKMVLICNPNYRERIENPNQAKSLESMFNDLLNSSPLKPRLAALILGRSTHFRSVFLDGLKDFVTSETNPLQTLCKPFVNQEQEQEQEQDINTIARKSSEQDVESKKMFQAFWVRYPKKVAKSDCEKIWKSKKCYKAFDQIMKNLSDREEKQENWVKNGEFVMQPDKYLRKSRWEDDIGLIGKNNVILEPARVDKEKERYESLTEKEKAAEDAEQERFIDEQYKQFIKNGGGK